MEEDFVCMLKSDGIAERTLDVLRVEDILNRRTFTLLHEEHLQKLLPKFAIGQHAILTNVWQRTAVENEGTQNTMYYG